MYMYSAAILFWLSLEARTTGRALSGTVHHSWHLRHHIYYAKIFTGYYCSLQQ